MHLIVLLIILAVSAGCGTAPVKSNESTKDSQTAAADMTSGTAADTGTEPADTLRTIGFEYEKDTSLGMEYIYAGRGDSERLSVAKTLIWVCDIDVLNNRDPAIFSYFNELLVNKYGCDFTVEFRGSNTMLVKSTSGLMYCDSNVYQNYLQEAMEKDEHIDILYSGNGMLYTDSYMKAVKDGMLIRLDDEARAEEWSVLASVFNETDKCKSYCIDGIYAVPTVGSEALWSVVAVNTRMAEKLGLEVPELSSMTECLDWLMTLERYVDDERTLVYLSNSLDDIGMADGYVKTAGGLYEHEKEEGSWEYVNIAEEKHYHEIWEKLYLLKEKGILADNNKKEDNDRVREGSFLCYVGCLEGDRLRTRQLHRSGGMVDIELIYSRQRYTDRMKIGATGIASWSEYQTEAYRLLTLIMTEPELANLLNSGIEGVHYKIVDGQMVPLTTDSSIDGVTLPMNRRLLYKYTDREEAVGEGEVAEALRTGMAVAYDKDMSGYDDKLMTLTNAKNSLCLVALNSAKFKNREEYENHLKDFGEAMQNIGLNEMVEELNGRLKEQEAKK